jgi:hypothetical protein
MLKCEWSFKHNHFSLIFAFSETLLQSGCRNFSTTCQICKSALIIILLSTISILVVISIDKILFIAQ